MRASASRTSILSPSSQSVCARARRVAKGCLGAEPAYCCSCPWLRSGSQRGSGYVRDAAIVTLHCLKLYPPGIVRFAAHQSRLKGEPVTCISIFYFSSKNCPSPLKITADDTSLPCMKYRPGSKPTWMLCAIAVLMRMLARRLCS